MSFHSPNSVGRKAVHVKWAGRTIALGTFAPAEAEEKCARAKALTRAWRSTMRPKPNREWVILELERLGVRVVSGGRAGKTSKGEADGDDEVDEGTAATRRSSANVGIKNSMDFSGGADQDFDAMMQRRSSSIGYIMMDGDLRRRSSSFGIGSEDVVMPPHRPLVGGPSAAAYEAAQADHYSSLAAKKRLSGDTPRRSSLGYGGMMSPSALGGGAPSLSASSNQHYEMLKLHHMNLLNEIQETTLMMNLYQQQQLQQQRQKLQEQERMLEAQAANGTPQMKMSQQRISGGQNVGSSYGGGMYGERFRGGNGGMMEGRGRSPSLGLGSLEEFGRSPSLGLGSLDGMNRRSSLGLGGSGSSLLGPSPMEQMQSSMEKQAMSDVSSVRDTSRIQEELLAQEEEQRLLEERLQKVRKEIAQRQREAEAHEASFGVTGDDTEKRKSPGSDDPADDDDDSSSRKKRKSDTSGVTTCEI